MAAMRIVGGMFVAFLAACGGSGSEGLEVSGVDASANLPDAATYDAQPPPPPCIDSTETDVIALSPDLPAVPPDIPEFHFTTQTISPDSERVLLLAEPDNRSGHRNRMFSVPICGGEAIELGPDWSLDPLAKFGAWRITLDSSRVAFFWRDSGGAHLYGTPITGGAIDVMQLAPQGLPSVAELQMSPTGILVFLRATSTGVGRQLYSVPTDGSSNPVLLAEVSGASDEIHHEIGLTAGGDRVVFAADIGGDGLTRLYSVPVDGGTITPLTPTEPGAAGARRFFHISGDHVLFTGSLDLPSPDRMYSTSAAGGAPTELGTLDGTFLFMQDVPGTSDVVFVGVRGDGIRRVYRATIGTPGISMLSGEAGFESNAGIGTFDYGLQLNSDATRVIFMDDRETEWAVALYSAPIAGGDVQLLSRPNEYENRTVGLFSAIPGTKDVVFVSEIEDPDASSLYRVSDTGGTIVTLAPEPDYPEGSVGNFRMTHDNEWIVVNCQCDELDGGELFKVRPDGSDFTPIFSNPGRVDTYDLSPDGAWVVWGGPLEADPSRRIRARRL